MDRHSGGGTLPHLRGRPVSGLEAAHANEYFEPFLNATTLKNILGYHRSMCEFLHLKPNVFPHFYPKLRANLTSWRAKALWKKFDARASHKCYGKGKICAGTRVLVIGAGPCGLRTAIEAQLLGAKVVLIEKRDRLSRNNVLHLWPFVIEDLRMLGAKKFFGKFCAGAIDHISIRQLQCILLKVALLLGVEVHTEVSFEHLLEPSATEKTGWRAEIKPENHPVSQYEFDVIIGADGKRNTLQGFKRKEFRGKLAIAITANFINKKSEAEARVEEISGVAFIFNQKFFKDLQGETRIDLENIVYYKDDTHYFVMTAKKASLLEKGVIKQDLSDTEKLLAPENVDREALQNYARQAADFSTNYQLPHLEFAVNHYGQPDVAMFDFTSMYAAEYASKVVERHGSRLLMILVGDSLLEPFWPTGSGCARGFLSSLDAAWAIRSYCSGQMTPLDVLAERESIYRLLAQTTPDNLNKDWKAYTLDPATRYPNLNKSVVTPHQTVCLYDTDNADSIDKMKRASLEAVSRQDHVPKKRRRGNVDNEVLLTWLAEQLRDHPDLAITDISSAFRNGKTLCAIIHHYRPDLLDYSAIQDNDAGKCNQMAMDILERDLGLPPFMTGEEITNTEDYLALTTYLTQVYDTFRGEIPHIKHPKLMLKPRTKIPKPASKSRPAHMSAAFLGKVKNLEAKCSQKSVASAVKHKANKAGGDAVSVGKEQKCDKLRTFFKESKVKSRIDRLRSGKIQRPISNDDSTVLQKDGRSRIPKKKLPKRHLLEPKPLQTLSEKTFLTASIKSFESAPKAERHVKMDFFDLTYSDNGLLRKNHSMDAQILRPQTEKPSKLPRKACSCNVREDKKAKKHKSRNVSLYVNLSERKPMKSKTLKTKKSKLSVIPENTEDKLNEIAKIISNRADKTNRAKLAVSQLVTKQPSVSVGKSVKVFRCETFVHDSAGSLTLPSIRSTEQLLKKQSASLEQAESSGPLVATTIKHKKSEFMNPALSKTSLRHEINLPDNLLGLASSSPLQLIRNHILMKKQQLSLVLSKPKVARLKSDNATSLGTSYSSTESINIQVIHHSSSDRITCQNVEYKSSRNLVKITSKAFVSKHPSKRAESELMMNSYRNSSLNFEKSHSSLREAPELGRNFPRYPDLKIHRRMKIRKSRTRLQAQKNPPLLTPADRQIIDSLGITGESDLRKTCQQQKSHNREVEGKRKFSLRSAIGRRQRLYGDHRPAKKFNHLPHLSGSSDRESDIKMEFFDNAENISPQMYTRVQKWISQHDFKADEGKKDLEAETLITCDLPSDITSVTRAHLKRKGEYDDIKVEQRTDVIKCESPTQSSQEDFVELVKLLKDGKATPQKETRTPIKPMSKYSQFNMKSVSAPPANFSVIIEGEESELPESNKRSEFSFKSIKTSNHQPSIPNNQPSMPSSRHKRHADIMVPKPSSIDRKQRKRRTLETIGPSVDYDSRITGLKPLANTNAEEDIAAKIRSLEDKWSGQAPSEKKPKDLMRAIGKIETSDWNIKQIEKKILENKIGKPSTLNTDKERVPRWSKEEFRARQTKMEKKHLDRQESTEAKYADIDRNIKQLELKLKEGTNRELGQNKVASITEKLVNKTPQEDKPVEKPAQPKPVGLPVQSGSEFCHFCWKRVYLMERVSAEGKFFHHRCFKCKYCHSQLRLGSYMFDRDGQYDYGFFCIHHFGMQGELPRPAKVTRKPSVKGSREAGRSPQKKPLSAVAGVDLLDRVRTPERIEFANLSTDNISDHEEPLSQMDEDEWTDKNFGASCNELDDSDDDSSSSVSDTDSDDEDAFDDALEQPITKEGTMKWAERLKNSYRKGHHSDSDGYSSSDHSSYYENSTDDSDSDTATEGEEEIRARELRRQEVRVEPPVVQTDTGTDTEMVSEESSSESSEIRNSATEISTDSEFAQDEPTPTRELPSITLNDFYVTKTRGTGKTNCPKRLQVTSGFIQRHQNEKSKPKPDIELKLSPLVPATPSFKKPTPVSLARTEGYALNRTQSTGGIAAKVSLELKKKYLLGESGANSIQKSGSASTLDTKFKSFQTTISDCQKLLKPAPEVSASMQMFCSKLDERHSPVLSPQGSFTFLKQSPVGETKQPERELPPPDITITTMENAETDYRPRSPVHETSIAVPSIDWSKQNPTHSSDSLSMSESCSENDDPKTPNFPIPRVEVHAAKESDKEEMALDSLTEQQRFTTAGESSKSITSEKKSLNQPKTLPNLESVLPDIHKALHVKQKMDKEDSPEENRSQKTMSGKSSPDLTAALTETELSDWARDENVSDSIELDISHQSSDRKKPIKMAQLSEFDEAVNQHVCGKGVEALNSRNLDGIEYMDTGTETSSEDGVIDSQNGYVLLKSEDDLAEDSLNPKDIFEARNVYLGKRENTGYCELVKDNSFGGQVVDLKASDVEKLRQKQLLTDHEEDSLLVVETGTTTEENTCSDSTVKQVGPDSKLTKPSIKIENLQKQRLEEKLAKVKAEQALLNEQKQANDKENVETNLHYEEHCQRLQSKVEFGNARDSIDIRKSRRKSKDSPQKPDLIQEEKERSSPPKEITLQLDPLMRPDVIYKKENIKKERDVNMKLIEEMVMNKMKAENKSLERKKRNRSNLSSLSPSIPKPNPTDIVSQINLSNLDKTSHSYATPDLLSDSIPPVDSSNDVFSTPMTSFTPKPNSNRPLSVFSTFTDVRKLPATPLTNPENFSMPDIRKNLFGDDFKTPKAPPRFNRPSDLVKTAEKMKETARARARLLSNEDLGLSPEEKINKLREKANRKPHKDVHVQESIESLVLNTERRNSLLYSNDTLSKKRNNSFKRSKSGDADTSAVEKGFSARPKSISEIPKNLSVSKSAEKEQEESKKKICMSDPNLLDTSASKSKKKSKDRERRKSITKLIAGIFSKKSPSGTGSKGLFAKLSPKSKEKSKSLTSLDLCKHETVIEETKPRKSLSELNIKRREPTPPPIPPLPANYTMKATDESSDGEIVESKMQDRSSCDTVDQSGNLDASTAGKKSGKARRVTRQAQLKRHRMAQEIQRKLEETEVKTRELEQRGVEIEKALRGEDGGVNVTDESDLLQEWFDLMRDRTELRRYEKELMVRAQELELEDRHSRLQLELRERIESNEHKTEEDLKSEQSIINEMMDIVAKRDALIAVLEADRLRYSHEDKDLEEQMLAKGLMLTPIQKTTPDK